MIRLNSLTAEPRDAAIEADEDAVLRAFVAATPVDLQIARRVQERSRLIRDEVFQKHGLVDIAVPAIRELRGPLP